MFGILVSIIGIIVVACIACADVACIICVDIVGELLEYISDGVGLMEDRSG